MLRQLVGADGFKGTVADQFGIAKPGAAEQEKGETEFVHGEVPDQLAFFGAPFML